MNIAKQKIIDEIRRTAVDNGNKPLGMIKFQKETGINRYEINKYWSRFGDAQKEAGFEANQKTNRYEDKFMIQQMIVLTRKLKKFPTSRERLLETRNNTDFPSNDAFRRFAGNQQNLINKVIQYCKSNSELDDVVKICELYSSQYNGNKNTIDTNDKNVGEVYLFKSGRYYKIGKTKDTVRRGSEIRIQLPEKLDLIHSIITDDPSGIEAYWHKRFASKRMQGEWFDLGADDIKAFKLWKKIV